MKKIFFSFALAIILICSYCVFSFASNDIRVSINGKNIDFPDVKPFIDENGRTLVPIKFISEALGAGVSWNNSTQEVNINKDATAVNIKIGGKNIIVNGSAKAMDTKAIIKDSRTFVPVRFIAEALGATVGWNASSGGVEIRTRSSATYLYPEYKSIIENIPGTFLREDGVLAHGDSSKSGVDDANWTFAIGNKGEGYLITLFKYDISSVSSLEPVLKQFYPKEYGELYKELLSLLSSKSSVSDPSIPVATYRTNVDNRYFSIDKYLDGLTIITIGK